MLGRAFQASILINAGSRQAAFLTLTFLLTTMAHWSHADPMPAADAALARQRAGEVATYIRKEAMRGMTALPAEMREVAGWFSGGWRPMRVADATDDDAAPLPTPLTEPAARESDFGLASNFHHKGFLPTHDAMMISAAMKQNFAADKLAFTARPYYGQNWRSMQHYWGGEVALDIAQRPDDMPWGKIALGYVGGDERLTDRGRGMELHGDVDLTRGFKFTSGVRQSSANGKSDYAMVNWSLGF